MRLCCRLLTKSCAEGILSCQRSLKRFLILLGMFKSSPHVRGREACIRSDQESLFFSALACDLGHLARMVGGGLR